MLHKVGLRGSQSHIIQRILWKSDVPFRTLIVTSSAQHNLFKDCSNTHFSQWESHRHPFQPHPVLTQRRHLSRETIAHYMSSDNPPIGLAQQVLENLHTSTGLPWWGTILLATCILRTVVTLPLGVYTIHISTRLEGLRTELGMKARQLKGEIVAAAEKFQWSDRMAHSQFKVNMKRLQKEGYLEKNCHPMKMTIMAWFQIPMWVSLSLALRNMSGALPIKGTENLVLAPGLANEGVLWFPNLLMPDATLLLPVAVGVLNLLIIEVNSIMPGTPSRFQKGMTFFLRGVSICMIPIAATVPSSMALYWTCSSFYGLTQNVLLKLPSVRRACHIPKMPSESQTPLKDIFQHLKKKYSPGRLKGTHSKKEQ